MKKQAQVIAMLEEEGIHVRGNVGYGRVSEALVRQRLAANGHDVDRTAAQLIEWAYAIQTELAS